MGQHREEEEDEDEEEEVERYTYSSGDVSGNHGGGRRRGGSSGGGARGRVRPQPPPRPLLNPHNHQLNQLEPKSPAPRPVIRSLPRHHPPPPAPPATHHQHHQHHHKPTTSQPCCCQSHHGNRISTSMGLLSWIRWRFRGLPYHKKKTQRTYRYDSLRKIDNSGPLEDEDQLKQHTWYQAGIPREIALEILMQQEIGSFIVRDSTTHAGCYALSVKVPKFENPTGISHYLIHRTRSGVKLKGLDKEWPNLTALVTHHTVMPEMLPCTLRLPRTAANPAFNEVEREDKEEDEDYQKLSDFSTMMAELKKL